MLLKLAGVPNEDERRTQYRRQSDHPAAELRETAYELARWQGGVDEQLSQVREGFKTLNGSVQTIENDTNSLKVSVGVLTAKVAAYGAAGGIVGAAVSTVIVQLLLR